MVDTYAIHAVTEMAVREAGSGEHSPDYGGGNVDNHPNPIQPITEHNLNMSPLSTGQPRIGIELTVLVRSHNIFQKSHSNVPTTHVLQI